MLRLITIGALSADLITGFIGRDLELSFVVMDVEGLRRREEYWSVGLRGLRPLKEDGRR